MLRDHALSIFHAGVNAVKPDRFIPHFVKTDQDLLHLGDIRIDLNATGRIIVVGGGKASAFMAQQLEAILGSRISSGVIVTKEGHGLPLNKITCLEAGHPVPDKYGIDGARKIALQLQQLEENDLVIALISGGASALIADVPSELSLEDMQQLNHMLLSSGADISEINIVRKHLSTLKGGQMRWLAAPARMVAMILSDVVGDPPDSIASGLTVADPSTFSDALNILRRYGLRQEALAAVIRRLQAGEEGKIPETPKPGELTEEHIITGSNRQALEAAALRATELGYIVHIITDRMSGEARLQAAQIMQQVNDYTGPRPACLLYGGETTVTIRGSGKGGRNQELALAALQLFSAHDFRESRVILLSAGTDGGDGPTDAAGAIADALTITTAREAGLDIEAYLSNNDSYTFFEKAGGLIRTGPTHTNVMDIVVVLIR